MRRRKGRAALVASAVVVALACVLALVGCKEAPVPMNLSVDATDAKTAYRLGEAFDPEGIVAKVRMNDGSDGAVAASSLRYRYANGAELIAGDTKLEKAGAHLVTADYNGLQASYQIEVAAGEATVRGISIASMPDKASYGTDDATLDLRGLGVTAYMSDGSTMLVAWTGSAADGITTEPANGASISDATDVKVTYGGQSAKFPVTFTAERTLEGIEIVAEPKVTNYSELTGYGFSAAGLVIQAVYSDGNKDVVRWSPDEDCEVKVDVPEGTTVAEGKAVTVTYKGATDTFDVSCREPKKVSSLAIVDKYLYAQTFLTKDKADGTVDYEYPTDLKAQAYYDDGTVVTVENKVLKFGGDTVDLTKPDTYTVTVSYTDPGYPKNIQEDSYTVTVQDRPTVPADKLVNVTLMDRAKYEKAYVRGEYEHPASVQLLAEYSVSGIRVVTSSTFSPAIDEIKADKTGEPIPVTVSYTDKQTQSDTFTVTIVDMVDAKSIAVAPTLSSMPTTFAKDEAFTYEGLVLDIRYNDDMMVTRSVAELQKIDGNDLAVTVAGPNSELLTEEGKFPMAGDWTVTVRYTPASKRPVGISSRALAAPLTCTYPVKVTEEATLEGVKILTKPHVTNYVKDGKFSAEGLSLQASYSDGTKDTVLYAAGNMTFSGDVTEASQGTLTAESVITKGGDVTVTYQGKTAAYAITYQAPKQVTKVSIVDKALYAVTLTRGDSYTERTASNTDLTVYYDDGTSEVRAATSVSDNVNVNTAKTYTVSASYKDPNYPTEEAKSDSYTVTVVEAVVPSVTIGAASVGLDTAKSAYVWKVKLSSGVNGASYTYRYGTDYAGATSGGPVTATGSSVDVEIPYRGDAGMKVWLTKVTAAGYAEWESTTVSTELPVIEQKVRMSVDKSTKTNWKMTLSAPVAESEIEYRYSTDAAGTWRTYEDAVVPVFPSGISSGVGSIIVEARLKSPAGTEVTSQTFERVTAADVRFEYGYMDPSNDRSYPTIGVVAPAGYVLEVWFEDDTAKRYRNEDQSNVAKMAVTGETARKMVVQVVGEESGARMMQTIKLTSGESRTWTKGTDWNVGGTGPMGGKIIKQDTASGKYWEVVLPRDPELRNKIGCPELSRGTFSLGELKTKNKGLHTCEAGARCTLWKLEHQVTDGTGVINLDEDSDYLHGTFTELSQYGQMLVGSGASGDTDYILLKRNNEGKVSFTSTIDSLTVNKDKSFGSLGSYGSTAGNFYPWKVSATQTYRYVYLGYRPF